MDYVGIFVGAVVQCGVGLLFYLAVQRNMEKVDRLQEQLDKMEHDRIEKLEGNMVTHEKEASEKRRKIYEEIGDIRTHFVHIKTCEKMHEAMTEQFEKFSGAVIDLARLQERTEQTAKTLEDIQNRLIAQGQDLAKMEGRENERR
jgi:uncharacterized membrane-anchored protein YhcB (DUF1043 family)